MGIRSRGVVSRVVRIFHLDSLRRPTEPRVTIRAVLSEHIIKSIRIVSIIRIERERKMDVFLVFIEIRRGWLVHHDGLIRLGRVVSVWRVIAWGEVVVGHLLMGRVVQHALVRGEVLGWGRHREVGLVGVLLMQGRHVMGRLVHLLLHEMVVLGIGNHRLLWWLRVDLGLLDMVLLNETLDCGAPRGLFVHIVRFCYLDEGI